MIDDEPGLRVVEIDTRATPRQAVDIVLFDSFAAEPILGPPLLALLRDPAIGHVVVYTSRLNPELVKAARKVGVSGFISKAATREQLVKALKQVGAGERVLHTAAADAVVSEPDWPGKSIGLTERESEVIALIVQGLSNVDIAERMYVSVNTLKGYIRSAYRRMGVANRSQAILWGIEHDFLPRRERRDV